MNQIRNKSKEYFKIISVEVPTWLNKRLVETAKANGLSKSEAMRNAFTDWIKKNVIRERGNRNDD